VPRSDHKRQDAFRPLLTILLLFALVLAAGVAPVAAAVDPAYGAVIASQQPAVALKTARALSSYAIEAAFTPAQSDQMAKIAGTLDLRYVNSTGAAQTTVYLRLYPNSAIYPAGGMTIGRAAIDGTPAPVRMSVHDTVAAINLAEPLAPGAAVDLTAAFTSLIPTDPRETYGMYQFDSETGVYALANWFPLLAGFDPDRGWQLDPPAVIGDPVFSNAALFGVQLSAPSDFKIAAGGSETSATTTDAVTKHNFVAGPARDFVIALSDRFQFASKDVGATTVTSYFLPDDAEAGANALTFGARALELYGDRFGTYPYKRMSLVETPLGSGAGGVEFPQLVFLGSDYFADNSDAGSLSLDFLVSHEVAHQWFYGQVGNDQYVDAFLDEALANVSALLDLDAYRGPGAAALVLERSIARPYRSYLTSYGDLVVDSPSEGFPSVRAYNAIVYGKAVLGFRAVRDRIGQTQFDAGLALYVARYRFTTADPQDLLACLNEAAGQEVTALWNHWFEETHGLTDLNIATPVSEAAS
jgi:hypothetical protein